MFKHSRKYHLHNYVPEQMMDKEVIKSMKQHYRNQLVIKLLFEGDYNDEKVAACSIAPFWKALMPKDCVYIINKVWEAIPEHILK